MKRFALCYRTVVLSVCLLVPACLSVTLVYCSQTVGWIKMKLGMNAMKDLEVGLGPGHNVLEGNPAPPKEAQPPICGPCQLWPNRCMDQDATNS